MFDILWLVVALPFLGFLTLVTFGSKFSRTVIAVIGAGSIGLSALLTIIIGIEFISSTNNIRDFTQLIWTWFSVKGLNPGISFYLDPLSLVFIFVITFVGFWIHIYSIEFMYNEEGFSRFFSYMNLFVGSMLTLVLADNLVLLYLGWEGVGLCSFLLIGFWYKDANNGAAAQKAFIVTRIGDTAMAIGLFLILQTFGTLDIQTLLGRAPNLLVEDSTMTNAIAFLLLGGALGKSAQLPLHTWLPDAMAGPSPVSALIHAATMVTAGVYLITRMNVFFTLAPDAQLIVAVIGGLTLLVAGFGALGQYDIKRVLAYSTISQIGYMFLALGVGAWSAAIFHFMIHAFFKALLFLAAGTVIICLHHEHNMFRMGGIRKELPVVFWTFVIGAASLAALPLITAGFYSKDLILWYSFAGEKGSTILWLMALLGAFITALYTFRMVFVTFFGVQKTHVSYRPGKLIHVPLIVLGVLSLIGGFIELPHTLGNLTLFSDFLNRTLPEIEMRIEGTGTELLFQVIAALTALLGIYIAYYLYILKPQIATNLRYSSPGSFLHNLWLQGWGFDKAYAWLLVNPVLVLSKINKNDFIDKFYNGTARVNVLLNHAFSYTQTGNLRWYAMGIVFGAILSLTIISIL